VNVGSQLDQSDPYTIPFSRGDRAGDVNVNFEVARGSGTSELSSISIDDLASNTNGQTQNISFTPDSTMEVIGSNEFVAIDLTDAQDGNVNYAADGQVNSATNGGATLETTGGTAYVYFEPSGEINAGTPIDIELGGVNAGATDGPYTVGFSRGAADTASTTFGTTFVNDPSAIQFNNFDGFTADTAADEFILDQVNVQDADNDDDLDRIEYEVTDSGGATVATETVTGIPTDQYQAQAPARTISGTVTGGELYTLTGTVYDSDGNSDSRSLDATSNTYDIVSVNPSDAGGNDIEVQFEIDTTDSGATVDVISLKDGSPRETITDIAVQSTQPQSVVIGGGNQATDVRVILYNSDGIEATRETVPYNP
jgi:hypothetical protein